MHMQPVSSSNIDSVGYSPIDKKLRVQFLNGMTYQYEGVPQNVALALVSASSVGKYFNANVRTSYPYKEI